MINNTQLYIRTNPPYNTGNDFVYNDNFFMSQEEINFIEENTGELGERYTINLKSTNRFHARWMNNMYMRLKVSKDLLKDNGVVFISIDDNEVDNLKKICDEIFGDYNFVAQLTIIVKPEGRRYGHFAKTHDYMLVYAKNIEMIELNEIEVEGSQYRYFDDVGGFNLKGLRNRNVQAFNSTNRPNLRYPFYVNVDNVDKDGLMSVSVEPLDGYKKIEASTVDGLQSVWRWGKDKSKKQIEDLVAYKGNDDEIRIFQKERKLTQTAKTVWDGKDIISNKGTKEVQELLGKGVFDFPKPLSLIKKVISIGTSESDIILDFFSGSGTTAHAIMQLNSEDSGNRKYILVQLQERVDSKSEYSSICEIGKERIRRAGSNIKEQNSNILIDTGFKVFRVDNTNIKWNAYNFNQNEQITNETLSQTPDQMDFVPNANDVDIVYELMLRQRDVSLSAPLDLLSDIGERTFLYANSYLVCLETKITEELVDKLAVIDPLPIKFIFRDSAFGDDIALKDETFRRLKALVEKNSGNSKKTYTVEFI